jgi:hypothetical protein
MELQKGGFGPHCSYRRCKAEHIPTENHLQAEGT